MGGRPGATLVDADDLMLALLETPMQNVVNVSACSSEFLSLAIFAKWLTASEIPNRPEVLSWWYHCHCADIIYNDV